MPYYATAQEWLTQSTLLLQARPTTTRITTKYTIPRSSKTRSKGPKIENSKKKPIKDTSNSGNSRIINTSNDGAATNLNNTAATTNSNTTETTKIANLTLKTYDPVSGATLKYKTNKAAEVGRLVQIMGRLGKGMAGLEMKEKEIVISEVLEKNTLQTETLNVKRPKKKGKK
ncbi:putative wd repeat protein [Golovinomyces cichoracearum]|uniref:Putative wd repeat protein n=1 Tax=Golovinomyces cichoracearum TaxID=62708 RepID=A0A420I901_9PEZI|nr:putative wd repeat protein [Golovinomyces cichoracearum]